MNGTQMDARVMIGGVPATVHRYRRGRSALPQTIYRIRKASAVHTEAERLYRRGMGGLAAAAGLHGGINADFREAIGLQSQLRARSPARCDQPDSTAENTGALILPKGMENQSLTALSAERADFIYCNVALAEPIPAWLSKLHKPAKFLT